MGLVVGGGGSPAKDIPYPLTILCVCFFFEILS